MMMRIAKRLREAEYTKLGMDINLAAMDIVDTVVMPYLREIKEASSEAVEQPAHVSRETSGHPTVPPVRRRGPGRPRKER